MIAFKVNKSFNSLWIVFFSRRAGVHTAVERITTHMCDGAAHLHLKLGFSTANKPTTGFDFIKSTVYDVFNKGKSLLCRCQRLLGGGITDKCRHPGLCLSSSLEANLLFLLTD